MKIKKAWKKYNNLVLANDLPCIIDINPDDYEFEMYYYNHLDPCDLKRIAKMEKHDTVVVYMASNIEDSADHEGSVYVAIAFSYVVHNNKCKRIGVRKDFTMHWEEAMNGSNIHPRFYEAIRKSNSENWNLMTCGVFNQNDMDNIMKEYDERIDERSFYLCSNYDENAKHEDDPRYKKVRKNMKYN